MNALPQASPRARILVVEDESLVAEDLQERLTNLGYEVCATADNGLEALALAEAQHPDIALLDIRIRGGMDGIQVAGTLRATSQIPVVFLTAHADEGTLDRAGATEPFGYVLKPFNERELRAAIEMALHRHAAEQRLRRMERWLATTLQSMGDGVIAVDLDGRINFINAMAESILGWSRHEAIGRAHHEVFRLLKDHSEDGVPDLIGLAVTEGVVINLGEGYTLRTREGNEVSIDDSIAPIRNEMGKVTGAVIIFRDCTLQRRAQAERRVLELKAEEAQRFESLGVMASGIAHDFNNLLTAITGNASLLRLDLTPESPHLKPLKEIERAAFRAANLCSQMLAYAGKSAVLPEKLDLSAVAQHTTQLLQLAVGKQAALCMNFERGMPLIDADRSQLQQVITNLVMNAAEAVEGRAGTVSVNTATFEATPEFLSKCRVGGDLPPGKYVLLEVSDNGVGMTPATQGRIFDPFFTTKFHGRGLGLSAVLGIVRSHGGALEVESAPGEGTTFRVLFLPAARSETTSTAEEPLPAPWRGSGRILLADDEESMRMVGRGILSALGFDPVTAKDPAEALRLLADPTQVWRAVVLDLAMPGMSGEETFFKLRELHPSLPVVLMSGYNRDEAASVLQRGEYCTFLSKPFRLEDLNQALRALLDPAVN